MKNSKTLTIASLLALALSFGLAQSDAKASDAVKSIELYETSAFSAVQPDKGDLKAWALYMGMDSRIEDKMYLARFERYLTGDYSAPAEKVDHSAWERFMTSDYAAPSKPAKKKGFLFKALTPLFG